MRGDIMTKASFIFIHIIASALVLFGCQQQDTSSVDKKAEAKTENTASIKPHENMNETPTPVKMTRTGEHEVNIEMTAQITDIEIDKGTTYKAWTFNGEAPGPLLVVNEGDQITFTLKNHDPAYPHSMDFHAVQAAPSKKFIDVMPNESGTFTYTASSPGVFMYHCGTKPVLQHIANGMHGMIIVKPADGYPTDSEIDREFALIQNEWYSYNDVDEMTNDTPQYVVFSAKALHEGDMNTNGTTFALKDKPLEAKIGEKIRIYFANMGPNETSSFHVVGTRFDHVYIDGNPVNNMEGMQTVLIPASGGAVVEFTVKEAGEYTIVSHQFNQVQKGAAAILKVSE